MKKIHFKSVRFLFLASLFFTLPACANLLLLFGKPTPPAFADVKSLQFTSASSTSGVVPNDPGFSSEFTVSYFIKGSTSGNQVAIGKVNNGMTKRSWYSGVGVTGAQTAAVFNLSSDGMDGGANTTRLDGTVTIIDGSWHQVTAVFKGSTTTMQLYVDGVLDVQTNSAQSSVFQSNVDITLASFYNSSVLTPSLTAKVDWVGLWDIAMDATQVAALWPGIGNPPVDFSTLSTYSHCTMWLPIGEGSDSTSTLFDRKSTNNATLTNISSGDFTTDIP